MHTSAALPIDAVLDDLQSVLRHHCSAVLVAPPGAGKTTRVPLALMDEPWAKGRTLVMLEPRRLAARAAAERMALSLGEDVGARIGLRARFDTRVSERTRVVVVTEGVFTRMILDDPGLDGIAGVIFDEFHERSLDADLGLALALEAQSALRDDLRLLVMSATLEGGRVAALLDGAPVIHSEGRMFPVSTLYPGRNATLRIEDDITAVILHALREETGSILVFLPGQREITRVAASLEGRVGASIDIAPLFGAMDRAAQDFAVRPARAGRRKIVLSSAIAETSLTIDGVRVVIDSGLARVPRFEPDLGVTRLETVRVSRASADQRRGRAGRTAPGVCYRLWEEAGTGALPPFGRAEILDADLSGLLLDLAAWGTRDPAALRWLDPPPAPAVSAARQLLTQLGALDRGGALTQDGRSMAGLAVPPRLARMITVAARSGAARRGADIATLLVERGLGGDGVDLSERWERWRRDQSSRAGSARSLARSLAARAEALQGSTVASEEAASFGSLLASSFPERIAKARGHAGEFLLASGRAAALDGAESLARETYLAVGEIAGRAQATRILSAAALSEAEVETIALSAATVTDVTNFNAERAALERRITTRLGALVLAERTAPIEPSMNSASQLAGGLAAAGLRNLPWTKTLTSLRGRVRYMYQVFGPPWPDLSDANLADTVGTWLAPSLLGCQSLSDVGPERLAQALHNMLPHALMHRLNTDAPDAFEAPTGSKLTIDYQAEGGPAIQVRVQELYGLRHHPTVAGHIPLVLHLLSPGQRPIQITKDLPGFWSGSWAAVRAEMRGRYPRHPWPDDPAAASPTTRAKPRGT